MPSPNAILEAATNVANDWIWLAVAWHAGFAALLLALFLGWRPLDRWLGYLLVAPIVSVSAMAWASANPFTGVVFAGVALLCAFAAHRLPRRAARLSSGPAIALGALFTAFGWVYPHFVTTTTWAEYLYAAPLGLLPCPTLTTLIGVTLICGFTRCAAWSVTMAAAAGLYGLIGVLTLRVDLDYVLLVGACVLVAAVALGERGDHDSRLAAVPGLSDTRRVRTV